MANIILNFKYDNGQGYLLANLLAKLKNIINAVSTRQSQQMVLEDRNMWIFFLQCGK